MLGRMEVEEKNKDTDADMHDEPAPSWDQCLQNAGHGAAWRRQGGGTAGGRSVLTRGQCTRQPAGTKTVSMLQGGRVVEWRCVSYQDSARRLSLALALVRTLPAPQMTKPSLHGGCCRTCRSSASARTLRISARVTFCDADVAL